MRKFLNYLCAVTIVMGAVAMFFAVESINVAGMLIFLAIVISTLIIDTDYADEK